MNRFLVRQSVLVSLLLSSRIAPAFAEVNQDALAQVKAGKVKVAKASWWGFDPEDSTEALQAAIDSGVPKLVVENMGKPWIVTPLHLASNQEILFEKGAEVLAKKGAFQGTGDSLFKAVCKENITLTGYGATLRMRRDDYDKPPYQKGEWRTVLEIDSCRNVKVYGLTLAESGGDGIYLGSGKAGVSNVNIHIKDVVCDKNYRQGISVITADGLLIENTVMRDTAGTPPMAGIDFEPNGPTERLRRVVMRNCTTEGNAGCGYAFYIPMLDATSAPVSVRLENCKAIGDRSAGLMLYTGNSPNEAVKGSITLRNCTFERTGSGIRVSDKPAGRCAVRFEKCAVLDVAATDALQSPIVLAASQRAGAAIGGITFRDCLVRDELERKPMAYQDSAGGLDLRDISGSLILEKKGQRTRVALTKKVLGEWMPVLAMKALPRLRLHQFVLAPPAVRPAPEKLVLAFASVRDRLRAALYAVQGENVSFRVGYRQVGSYGGKKAPVVVTAPSGKEVQRGDTQFLAETEVAFTAPETGLYRIAADPNPNSMAIVASSHPACLVGDGDPVSLISSQGELFFWVPAGTKEFAVRVIGEGNEGIKAGLYNADGALVEEKDDIGSMHQFLVALPQASAGEAWSLRLTKGTHLFLEDYHLDLRNLPPLLAPSREAVLRATVR